ncbi:antitoxin VapB family protein [Halobaculum sp. CBA1158]|nr:antitoxin VapB family protein [Halobaculum sp. CBA1158]UIP00311.1 antitoxin VapB family protein [Halobaculum sp. CBA1158]
MGDDTTVRISRDTWKRLNDRREPGVSFDDVINGLLDEVEDAHRDAPAQN